jgi:uncharacterized protein YbjT (DUF2867 family)
VPGNVPRTKKPDRRGDVGFFNRDLQSRPGQNPTDAFPAMKTLLLLGATGLVGRSALDLAAADPAVGRIVAPTRRPLPPRPKLENPQIDYGNLPAAAPWWAADAAICTLGTTLRLAGSPAAFRRIDCDYVIAAAQLARAAGTAAFAYNSSLGADPRGRTLYLRVKGETESALAACGFASLTLVRPGLLGGRREEFRPGERFAQLILGLLRPLLPPRYRMVPAEAVARTLLASAFAAAPGCRVVESEAIR